MAKFLLFTLEYPPFKGGIANYYENIVKYFPGKELAVLHDNDGRLINDKLPFLKWLPAVLALWRRVRAEKIEQVLVGHLLPLGTAALAVKIFLKFEYSVILHGMDLGMALARPRKKRLARLILKNAACVIAGNRFTADLAVGLTGQPEKIQVVNPGVEADRPVSGKERLQELKNKFGLQNETVLLTVGRLVRRKGADMVIKSLPYVLEKMPAVRYFIVGNGPDYGYLKQKIDKYGLAGAVMIVTDADDGERNCWYDLCDIFLMPARAEGGNFEGFGIVYLEANIAGKPVIAGRSGGVPDAVLDGATGVLVNPNDKHEIAEAIIRLVSDRELRERLGRQGRARALEEFSWPGQVEKIYNLINNL